MQTALCPISASPIFVSSAVSAHTSVSSCGSLGILMIKCEKLLLLLNSNSFTIFFLIRASNYKIILTFEFFSLVLELAKTL